MRKLSKENWILLTIMIFGFLIRLAFTSNVPWWDESVYLNLGYDLSSNPLDYSVYNHGWSDFIPSGGDENYAWPKMGFRPPLLPYILAIFYVLKLSFIIKLLLPLMGTLTIFLVYLLGKEMFNKKVGIISAAIICLVPIHVMFSGIVLNDVFVTFFITLSFLFFWKGFEKGNEKYKILFGITLGLGLLTRYTMLWIIPIFPVYLWIRNKSLSFLKDKYLWYAIIGFFVVLIPWFIYGYFEYGNILGGFLHGFKGTAYWGGIQSWFFFFEHWLYMFSISGILFVLSLIWIFYTKDYKKREIYILLIWSLFYLMMLIIMPHKEERFVIPIIPAISLLLGLFISQFKKYQKLILFGIVFILFFSLILQFYHAYKSSYTETNSCFLEGNKFLKNIEKDALIVTDESPIIYYYTKKETRFYPNPWSSQSLRNVVESYYEGREVYIFFTDYDMPLNNEKNIQIKEDLDANFKKAFECYKNEAFSIIYIYD